MDMGNTDWNLFLSPTKVEEKLSQKEQTSKTVRLASFRPETRPKAVILRSERDEESLTYWDRQRFFAPLRMTFDSFRMDTSGNRLRGGVIDKYLKNEKAQVEGCCIVSESSSRELE